MKKTIKETREKVATAKAEEAKEAAKEARLAEIEPIDIVQTMEEVKTGQAKTQRDANGYAIGVNGGLLKQKMIMTREGPQFIGAYTEAELQKLEEDIKKGKQGDGLFHRVVIINGYPCDCAGATEKELEEDIEAAQEYAKRHSKGSVIRDLEVAEELVEAEYDQKDLEQLELPSGKTVFLCYSGKYVMDTEGKPVADLDDLTSPLTKEDTKKLLWERACKADEEEEWE